jgi:hypothetical protein
MQRLSVRVFGVIVAVLVVVALLYLFIKEVFKGADPTVTAASEAAIATALVSLGAVLIQRLAEIRTRRESSLRPNKEKLYKEFLLLWAMILDQVTPATTPGVPATKDEANAQMMALLPDVQLWASNEVIVRWSEFRRYMTERVERINRYTDNQAERDALTAQVDPQYFLIFEKLILAVRKDLGHSPEGLGRGDVLGLWINDIDKFFTRKTLKRWKEQNKENRRNLIESREHVANNFTVDQFGVAEK